MFSEYASKFLSQSQKPAPLFDEGIVNTLDTSDTEAFLGWVGESLPSSALSDDDTEDDPPEDLAVQRPRYPDEPGPRRHGAGDRTYTAWRESVRSWNPTGAENASNPVPKETPKLADEQNVPSGASAGPSRIASETETHNRPFAAFVPVPVPTILERTVSVIYLISLATSLATAFLVTFSTAPSKGGVYPVFTQSVGPLVFYAFLAVLAATGWIWMMRSNARAVIQTTTFAVPLLATSTGIYGLWSSWHNFQGHGAAHFAMRLVSFALFAASALWVVILRMRKDVLGRATEMIALAVQVVENCPQVLGVSAFTGIAAIALAALWVLFLSRAFLEGSLSLFYASIFSFIYFWTLGVLGALQKCVVTSVTMGWYNSPVLPGGSTAQPVLAGNAGIELLISSTHDSVFYRFGSCCLSSLISLLVRLPLLVLPRRLTVFVEMGVRMFAASQTLALLDPLTLSTAVVARVTLPEAAEKITSPTFVAADRRAYRHAKLLLAAARTTCGLVIGFLAWAHADHSNTSASVYGYIIGIVGFLVGWTVVGAVENTLSMLIDGLFVCYLLDPGPKHAEADRVFGALED